MAKVISLIELKGTYDGVTYVKSSTYGNHIRAKRGTHKKAVLNAAYQKQNEKLVKSNIPAKVIKDAIDPYREDFYDGTLWHRLISITNEQELEEGGFDFAKVRPFDLHKAYPFDRLFDVTTETTFDPEKSQLDVNLTYNVQPEFDESLPLDGYRLQVIAIFQDSENSAATTAAVSSDVIQRKGPRMPLQLGIPVPTGARAFLLFVRVDGCEKGRPDEALASKGMMMAKAGRI